MLIKDIEKMEAYTPTEYVNDSEPDLDADNLNKTERQLRDTVAKANEIIDTLKSLISNVSVNSEDTVPSSAVTYKMEQDIEELNSNMIKNKQDASVNPDVILTTDIRTLNGWDAELQKHIPQQLRNQWITCITSSPYDGSASEAVCQIMIGTSSGIIATRNGRNGGGWSNYFVK